MGKLSLPTFVLYGRVLEQVLFVFFCIGVDDYRCCEVGHVLCGRFMHAFSYAFLGYSGRNAGALSLFIENKFCSIVKIIGEIFGS
mgnify:CR=1 FL=1